MLTSTALLDSFRRDRARGINDDIDLTLRPSFRELLAKLGDPHTKLPPVFHVAGTNGKGSVCAFLRSMLEAAGKRVHVYTSPHLVRFHERIRVAGTLISEAELVEILQLCRTYAPEGVTYFEAATAAAFTAFARHPADFTILEVGLGGRLDATNIIPPPLASIITRISFDHREYLGETLADIAYEKAGIMRRAVPCFAAAQPDDGVLDVLRSEAAKKPTSLKVDGIEWRVAKTVTGFQYSDENHTLDLPQPALLGEHQYQNAGLAVAALLENFSIKRDQNTNVMPAQADIQRSEIKMDSRLRGKDAVSLGSANALGVQGSGFGEPLSPQALAHGLRSVTWPGRLQKITEGALADLLPETWELWLDGGHNDSAGAALARQAEMWNASDARPLHLICGMLTTKRPTEFLSPLAPSVASLTAVPIVDEPASFTPDNLLREAQRAGMRKTSIAADVGAAISFLVRQPGHGRILICGSLYLAGLTLRQNGTSPV